MAFAELTEAQGAILRNRIGDTDIDEPKLSDVVLDACYTEAENNLDLATVKALQQLVGIYAMHVRVSGSSELTEDRQQRYEHLKEWLAYWETQTGTTNGLSKKLRRGRMRLSIDTDADDL